MNMRIDENNQKITKGNQVDIGGNERYISTCRKHFNLGLSGPQKAQKATASLQHETGTVG